MEKHAALQQELLALEQRYWTAIQQKDSRTAARLSDDPCLVVGAQGVGELHRGTLAKMLEQATYELQGYSLKDVHVRPLGEDVVALAYTVEEDLRVDGKKLSLKAFDTSVWAKKDGAWACVLHTESLAGDPFGRH